MKTNFNEEVEAWLDVEDVFSGSRDIRTCILKFYERRETEPIVSYNYNDFLSCNMSLQRSALMSSWAAFHQTKMTDIAQEILYFHIFFLPLFAVWIVCVFFVAGGPDTLRFQDRNPTMMKTITDVVFCVMMTQNYMDEQIFENPLFLSKGTPLSWSSALSKQFFVIHCF